MALISLNIRKGDSLFRSWAIKRSQMREGWTRKKSKGDEDISRKTCFDCKPQNLDLLQIVGTWVIINMEQKRKKESFGAEDKGLKTANAKSKIGVQDVEGTQRVLRQVKLI